MEDYPQFLPWCGGATINEMQGTTMHATVHIDYHHIKQHFSTENQRKPPHQIDIALTGRAVQASGRQLAIHPLERRSL